MKARGQTRTWSVQARGQTRTWLVQARGHLTHACDVVKQARGHASTHVS